MGQWESGEQQRITVQTDHVNFEVSTFDWLGLLTDHGYYGLLADFRDGTMFLSHPLFSLHPNSLPLLLYYDDVEFVIPLDLRSTNTNLVGVLLMISYIMLAICVLLFIG